ncbi:hypothetical protein [Actomonas aquatica]|uniref:Lipoprotein n=1 Tax=Actomonas aquatica TaxID=2866162 RepID=A0ABZ1C7M8_9BACT|nr:hypothetical protein [Opitutus sp. WL0086]WRQ87716.1 hypothetical protein K1X11_023135 [Opitutus sp. WL0086]
MLDRLTPRPAQRVIWLTLSIAGLGLLLTGCQNSGIRSRGNLVAQRDSTPASARPFSVTEQAVILEAARAWHKAYGNESHLYQLDPYDRRITRSLRTALSEICRPLPKDLSAEDPHLFTLSIDEADLPQGNFAYASIRVGNRYEVSEHAYVYEAVGDRWEFRDHYLIAEGLMQVALIDFGWEAYCRDKGIKVARRDD